MTTFSEHDQINIGASGNEIVEEAYVDGPAATSRSIIRDLQGSLNWDNPTPHFIAPSKIDHGNKVVLFEDYSDPLDLQCESDDYTEPYSSQQCSSRLNTDIELYEDVSDHLYDQADCKTDDDYDNPWEWEPSGKLCSALKTATTSGILNPTKPQSTGAVASAYNVSRDIVPPTMTARQRHFYETAFDSTVKRERTENEIEEITNHPVLRNDPSSEVSCKTVKTPIRAVTSHEVPNPGYLTPQEKRKVTLIRDGTGRRTPKLSNKNEQIKLLAYKKVRDGSPGFRTEQVKAIVHPPPRSANSTPLLTHRLRRIDSIASSARSTPTHYVSSPRVRVDVPTKPLSDLTLGSSVRPTTNPRHNIPSFHVIPSTATKLKSSYSSEGRFSFQSSDGDTQPSTSDSVLSETSRASRTDSSSETLQTKIASDVEGNGKALDIVASEEQLPYNFLPKRRTLPFSFSLDSAQLFEAAKINEPLIRPDRKESADVDSQIQKKPQKPSLSLALNKQDSLPADPSSGSNRANLNLSFGDQTQKRKQLLQLNFGCAALSVVGEKVDLSIPLERQGWYHGSISRVEAENVLRLLKEGSYLVRNSESNKHDYSLSLKSARGFMHMKIVNSDAKYILGQFSKPFNSIPEMINHYILNKLPIKGAEHMSLLYPVIDQLL